MYYHAQCRAWAWFFMCWNKRSNAFSIHTKGLFRTDCAHIIRFGGWPWQVLRVKKPDVGILSWHGYSSSAALRPVGDGHSLQGQQLWWTFLQSACQLHAPSKGFFVISPRHTCVIIMWLMSLLICHICPLDGLLKDSRFKNVICHSSWISSLHCLDMLETWTHVPVLPFHPFF